MHPYEDPDFTYGNWNEPHLYLCVYCLDEHPDRHQPPVGVIELLDTGGSPSGDFQALCWRHMRNESAAWAAFIERHRHNREVTN